MQVEIKTLSEKKLVGYSKRMSFAENTTRELWQQFMPNRKEIKSTVNALLYSIEVYDPLFFNNFNPMSKFDKWAAVEVANFDDIYNGMETIILPPGLYAVFLYKGPQQGGAKAYQYIFESWIPQSDFILDNRPHFALMGEKYKGNDPDSEEELWIPVKSKI